jgi:hypothetical protein
MAMNVQIDVATLMGDHALMSRRSLAVVARIQLHAKASKVFGAKRKQ